MAGIQLTRKNTSRRLRKKAHHRLNVARARPDRSKAVKPGRSAGSADLSANEGRRVLARVASARSPRPWSLSQLIDSGSQAARTGRSSKGAAPPAKNTAGQPQCWIRGTEAAAPTTAPSGMPQNIAVTVVARRRGGENSADRATMLGMAPPRPNPVKARYRVRSAMVLDIRVAKAPAANIAVVTRMVRRRPLRSAITPKAAEPRMPVKRPMANAGPKPETGTPQALAITGATKAIAWVSKPSSMATRAHRPTTRTW